MPRARKITVERVREYLDYNPDTGSLTWKKNTTKANRIGNEAAPKAASNGYRYVSFDKGDYLAQRLIWAIMKGEFSECPLTFKDGNRLNLKWENIIEKKYLYKSKYDYRNPEGKSAYAKMWREENAEEYKSKALKSAFGIDMPEYRRMFASQGGVCAICKCEETTKRNGKLLWLAVDHDHGTNAIRGLLCQQCNKGIGALKDSADVLQSAAEYLRFHKSKPKEKTNVIKLKKGN